MKIVFLGNFQVDHSSETHHKKSLEALGHEVIPLQEGVATSEQILQIGSKADMFVWVHTHGWRTPGRTPMQRVLNRLKMAGVPTVSYHLDLWFGLRRQEQLRSNSIYKYIGHFFTVDKQMADWFNKNTRVKGHYLPAGVFDQECYLTSESVINRIDKVDPNILGKDVIFVGSKNYHPEWKYRPELINWLENTYGDRFARFNGDTEYGVTRGDKLNAVYATSKVAVGDSLCLNFNFPYYWSDRVYETLGRGGFIIHPYIQGMEEHFTNGEHLVFYEFGNFADLQEKIDYYISHDIEREKIRLAGHKHVKNNHTYKHRWQEIIEVVNASR